MKQHFYAKVINLSIIILLPTIKKQEQQPKASSMCLSFC